MVVALRQFTELQSYHFKLLEIKNAQVYNQVFVIVIEVI